MKKDRGVLYTYSGKIAFPGGSPSLLDIAISLSREGRYAGAGLRFWPVALHTFVVCDMLPDCLKWDGLMHDSSECIGGDVPKPVKTDASEAAEKEVLVAIYESFGEELPSYSAHKLIKQADHSALHGEVYTVGTQSLQAVYGRCPEAEELVIQYANMYTYDDCLNAGGKVPIEFMRRFHQYKLLKQRG